LPNAAEKHGQPPGFIFSLSGETEFAKGWFLSGETLLQKGGHDKDISASVQFKRVW